MGIAGVPAGAPPGTKAGTEAGDLAGQKTDVTVGAQTIDTGTNPGGTISVGTIPTQILTVPRRGIYFEASVVKAAHGGTFAVNAKLDGNDLLSANDTVNPPGGTITSSPDQNRQAADKQLHTLDFVVRKFTGPSPGTITVTPTLTGLSD